MATQERLYTAGDLWALSHQVGDHVRLELIKGVVRAMTPTGGKHGVIAGRLLLRIGLYVEEHRLGHVTAAETGYQLSTEPDTVIGLDVGFVTYARLAALPDGYVPLAPDLAVEVVSPGDRRGAVQRKVRLYLSAGTQLVWVVHPKRKNVVVHSAAGTKILIAADTLDGGDVLPGFSLPVGSIFDI